MLRDYFILRNKIKNKLENYFKIQTIFHLQENEEELSFLPYVQKETQNGIETFRIITVSRDEGFKGINESTQEQHWFEEADIEMFDLAVIIELIELNF